MLPVVLSFFAPLIAVVIHAIVLRTPLKNLLPKSPQNSLVLILVFLSGIAGALVVSVHSPENPSNALLEGIYTFATSLAFDYAYFHFFNMSETARRIHIIVLIHEGDSSELKDYQPESMLKSRIDRLIEMKVLRESEGRLTSKRSFVLYSAMFFRKWRQFIYG